MIRHTQLTRGTAAKLAEVNPVLLEGELVAESDTGKIKIGDGTTTWNNLPYITSFWKAGASGEGSIATVSGDNTATGDYSVAMGQGTTASGGISTAIGYGATASGFASVGIGDFVNATGSYSFASGATSTASGMMSTATGNNTVAAGNCSFAGGQNGTAYGEFSFAFGNGAVSGVEDDSEGIHGTVAIGDYAHATHANSVALGNGSATTADNTVAVGNPADSTSLKRITGLADGVNDNDAVTLGQIKTADATTKGIVKLYSALGTNTDGALTQAAAKTLFDGKAGLDSNAKVPIANLPVVGASGSHIIEHGSNANGEYVKFADGTAIAIILTTFNPVIQTPTTSGLYMSNEISIPSPISFIETYRFCGISTNLNAAFGYARSNSPNTILYRLWAINNYYDGTHGDYNLNIISIGRWK